MHTWIAFINSADYWDDDAARAELDAENAINFELFLTDTFRRCHYPHPNPLSILMRAVNATRLVPVRLVPRWRRGRWKSRC